MALALRHPGLNLAGAVRTHLRTALAGALALGLLAVPLATLPQDVWARLLTRPALLDSALMSLWTGLASTALAFAVTVAVLAALHGRPVERWLAGLAVPLLAVPHAAFAVGFAFLIAPSGWMVRLASPALTGLERPPDWPVPGDSLGLSLIAALVLRELPFLLLVGLAAKARIGLEPLVASARTLGCGRAEAFVRAAFPQIRRRMRVPVLAVLAYGTANVDMAAVLGPDLPAPLAVRAVRWFLDPDPSGIALATAAVPLLALLVLAAILLWRPLEVALCVLLARWPQAAEHTGVLALPATLLTAFAALCALGLWAVAGPWPFPAALPASFGLRTLRLAAADLSTTLATTVLLALMVATLAVLWARALLRAGRDAGPMSPLVLLPLFAPPVVVAPLLQRLAVHAGVDGTITAVAAGHLVYALPYALLVLEGPVRRLSPQLLAAARTLGARGAHRLLRVELPLLAPAYALAFATALSVSLAQYETTLFLGGGRVRTLTTETIAYLAAGDRRLAACAGLLASLVPLLGFLLPLPFVRRGLSRRAAARTAPRCPPR